jgi:ABC-type branched-subunit amino acid transport system permease subunit
MVLAGVVIGGRWGLAGVVLGGLTVGAYDRVLADVLTGAVRGVGTSTGLGPLAAADLHGSSYALFGLALYAAILLRTRSAETTARLEGSAARPTEAAHAPAP